MPQHDLVTLWFEEKRINELAVQKKKEQKEKARDACEASWSKVGFFLKLSCATSKLYKLLELASKQIYYFVVSF